MDPSALPPPLDQRYRSTRVLGEGSFGRVVAARQVEGDEVVAIKLLHPQATQDSAARERFMREARLTGRIHSPHVARVLDYGVAQGTPFIVYGYVDGPDLERFLHSQGGRLELDEALAFLEGILQGLRAAHKLGIVHRDLKPANILLTSEGVPVIADFGLARAEDGRTMLTRTGAVMGTIYYMPPDQFDGGDPAPHWDLYAAGVLFLEVATGRIPFKGRDVAEVHGKKLDGLTFGLRDEGVMAPPQLDRVLERVLSPDPSARPASATAFLAQLASALGRDPLGESAANLTLHGPGPGDEGGTQEVPAAPAAAPPGPAGSIARGPGEIPAPDPVEASAVGRPAAAARTPSGLHSSAGLPAPGSASRSGAFARASEPAPEAPGPSRRGALAALTLLASGAVGVFWGAAPAPPPPAPGPAPAPPDAAEHAARLERAQRLRADVLDEPKVQRALALDARVLRTQADALPAWREGRAVYRQVASDLPDLGAALALGPRPRRELVDELSQLALIDALLEGEGLEVDAPPLWPGQEPLAPALERAVRWGPAPRARDHAKDSREATARRIRRRLIDSPGRRWETIRSMQALVDLDDRGVEGPWDLHLQDFEGQPFLDPRKDSGTTELMVLVARRSPEDAQKRIELPLRRTPGDLVLAIVGYAWSPKFQLRLVLWGQAAGEEPARLTVSTPLPPKPEEMKDVIDSRDGLYLRVAADVLPAGLHTAHLTVVGIQPIGDPRSNLGIEEVHQLVEGPPPEPVAGAWR